jgi:hypothetical protein
MALPRRLQIKLEQRLREESEARNARLQRALIIGFLILAAAELIARNWSSHAG